MCFFNTIYLICKASQRESEQANTLAHESHFIQSNGEKKEKNHLHPAINAITQAKLTSYQKIRIHTHTSHFIHSNAMCECVCLSAEIHLMRFSMVSS